MVRLFWDVSAHARREATSRSRRDFNPARQNPARIAPIVLYASTALSLVLSTQSPAFAACDLIPSAGNDVFVCDDGISAGDLVDLDGDNTLTFPAGGSGTVNGNVTFGAGADRIDMQSGTIDGAVQQGDGQDVFIIGGGTVTGNVQQGSGIDDFQMSGGQIGSLNQGDGLDTFTMSGGRIVDFFDDGDYAVMTGGRIGRVNMKLDDNYFNTSGGIIDRNLVTGFGNDTIILSDGTIGGNISVSGGTDSVTVTGGSVGGDVLTSFGTDSFRWDGGGIIYGKVDLGGDNDTAALSNLTNANLGAVDAITGGLGEDALTLSNVNLDGVARLQNWETINATNDTELMFDGTLTLGDSGTGTGSLTVDAASTIYGGGFNGGVAAFDTAQLAKVVNAGRIDLTNGGDGLTDTFTVAGNYTGDGGLLLLQTELGDDSSASDRLVISGGTASGSTGIGIINVGGAGGSTTQDGIMVVEVTNGATSESGSFALDGPVAAGAFEYYLFKGGVSAGTEDSWYLRSTLVAPPAPEPTPEDPDPVPPPPPEVAPAPDATDPLPPESEVVEVPPEVEPPPPPPVDPAPPPPPESTPDDPDPVDPAPPVEIDDPAPETPPPPPPVESADPPPPPPTPPTEAAEVPLPTPENPGPVPPPVQPPPPTPGATAVEASVIPLYRIEVPTYAVVPPAATYMMNSMLGTFHERRGEQSLLDGSGYLPATWGRVFGQDAEMKWDGTVAPSFDGDLIAFQAGSDLIGWEGPSGHQNRAGLFIGHTSMDGDVRGQALGWNNLLVGKLNLDGTSFGGYWTHIGPGGWYLDGVIMGTWFNGNATSSRDVGIDLGGTGITASLEGGYPIALGSQWTLEPQAQLIWQHLSLDDQTDRFSTVSFDTDNAVTGRVGARLQGTLPFSGGILQPYLKANLWHDFDATDSVSFGGDPILTDHESTSLEFGGGVVAKLSDTLSVFATADYTTNLGGEKRRVFEGNLGLNIKW